MTFKTFPILAIIATLAVAGTVGLTVIAGGHDSAGHGGGLLHHLHRLGQHLHGDGGHDSMARLIEQLELTADQSRRLEQLHEILANPTGDGSVSMAELHEQLVTQFQQGRVEIDGIRQAIDSHVEQLRAMAYAATDELVALVNSLDARQRDILMQHLQAAHDAHHGHGH